MVSALTSLICPLTYLTELLGLLNRGNRYLMAGDEYRHRNKKTILAIQPY